MGGWRRSWAAAGACVAVAAVRATPGGGDLCGAGSGACEEGLTRLRDATDFEALVGRADATCVVFFQEGPAWEAVRGEFEKLGDALAGRSDLGVASMAIEDVREVSHKVAATGPISVKIFDKRLRTNNYYDLYALHRNGPRFAMDAHGILSLMTDYVLNSTADGNLDIIATDMSKRVLVGDDEGAQALMARARGYVREQEGERGEHVRLRYLKLMAEMVESGIYVPATHFNRASLKLANAARPNTSARPLPLVDRAAVLLDMHISSVLAGPLLQDVSASQFKRPAIEQHAPRQDESAGAPAKPTAQVHLAAEEVTALE